MENISQLPTTGTDSAERVTVVVAENSSGTVVLPQRIYESIAGQLPLCLQHGDDDRNQRSHSIPLCLKAESEERVTLQTRNSTLLTRLLHEQGFRVQVLQSFADSSCAAPSYGPDSSSSLLSTINCAGRTKGSDVETLYETTRICRAAALVSPADDQKFDWAAIFCGLFPNTPIVFVVASGDEGKLVASKLANRLPEKIHLATGLSARPECRITVATFGAIQSVDLLDAPIVIVPVWKPGYPMWMKRLIWNPHRDRLYFLLTYADPLSDRDIDGLEGRVGPILFRPGRATNCMTTFSTFRFGGQTAAGSHRTSHSSHSESIDFRSLYWRHRSRNQALAALAKESACSDSTTGVLVANRDHAEQLSRLLPAWTLVLRDTIPGHLPARLITTLTAADAWPQFQPDTLVVGMGGSPSDWLMDMAERLKRGGKPIRVIDLTDGFDESAGRLAIARQNAYREAGWHSRPLDSSVVRAVGQAIRTSQTLAKSS